MAHVNHHSVWQQQHRHHCQNTGIYIRTVVIYPDGQKVFVSAASSRYQVSMVCCVAITPGAKPVTKPPQYCYSLLELTAFSLIITVISL